MLRLRLERRLQGSSDPEDMLEEAFVDASRRLPSLGRTTVMCRKRPGPPTSRNLAPGHLPLDLDYAQKENYVFNNLACSIRTTRPFRMGSRRPDAVRARLQLETLEDRSVPSTLTGFSLVEQQGFPGPQTTVVSLPTTFKDTIDQTWQGLRNGTQLINSGTETLAQMVESTIQQNAQGQGVNAYNISESFASQGAYSATLDTSQGDPTLTVRFDLGGNTLDFTTTTDTIFGSWADPTFHVVFDMTIDVNLTLPSTISPSTTVTASATSSIGSVTVSSNNAGVWWANVFGNNICQSIASGISGNSQSLPGLVPAGPLSVLLQGEANKGYTHLHTGLDSSGNLLLTGQTPNLVLNGFANDDIFLETSSDGTVTASAGGKWGTFDAGYLKTITINCTREAVRSTSREYPPAWA